MAARNQADSWPKLTKTNRRRIKKTMQTRESEYLRNDTDSLPAGGFLRKQGYVSGLKISSQISLINNFCVANCARKFQHGCKFAFASLQPMTTSAAD